MGNGIGLVVFNSYDGFLNIQCSHQQANAHQQFFSFFEHQAVVAGQVGLTFYAVDDEYLAGLPGGGENFKWGGKVAPPKATIPALPIFFTMASGLAVISLTRMAERSMSSTHSFPPVLMM